MWKCNICSESVEDEENFCYHCGGGKGEPKPDRPTATPALGQEPAASPECDMEQYGVYHRDWLLPIKRLGIRHGAAMFLAPLFGFFAIHSALTARYMSSLERIGFTILGIALVAVSAIYLNAVTKVPGPKK